MAKIKMLDINGNWVWLDTTTNQTTSITPLTGTIQVNTTRSVGGNKNTKRGRTLIAHNLVQNYNNRQTKVHNYGDLTRRLKLKRLTVSIDNTGEPIINLADYNPGVEAPMKPYTPLEEFYVGTKVLDLPFKFGNKAIQYGLGRYGSKFGWNEAQLSARNKILSDVFDKLSLKLRTPLTTTLLYLTLKFNPITPNEKGALTFFQRKPSKISIAERIGIPKGERNLPKNGDIVSMTPEQWTAAQDAAIARGDMAEAQRLRDLHFKVSAPDTKIKDIQYHGAKGNAKFNVFNPELIGQTDPGWAGRGYYFTPSIDYAKMYGSEPRAFYINAQKVHDGTAATYFGRENSPAASAFKIIRKRHNNDGQQILDELASSDAIRTSFLQTQPYNSSFEEVVTRNNNQMKLADAVTFDDNGVRIPLGERDNFNINDIRYGLLPLATGYTLYNNLQ